MAKSEPREYRAMISDEGGGVVRGRIPAPLVREMGARAGDYMIFHSDGAGKVSLSVSRRKKAGQKSTAAVKSKAGKAGKKR